MEETAGVPDVLERTEDSIDMDPEETGPEKLGEVCVILVGSSTE